MDVTNIDGANGNEAPGYLNERRLIQECARELTWADLLTVEGAEALEAVGLTKDAIYVEYEDLERVKTVFSVLRKRGLLNSQALELLQRDGDLTPLPR